MTDQTHRPRIGFFTRLLERTTPAERYRYALEQIEHAERHGFASAWLAQHHFGEDEGGLPSPFVLLAAAARQTSRIALATGVITLPIDDPVRAAEDASVLDALSGGRVQLGVAAGGTPSSFAPFGRASEERRELFADHFAIFLDSLSGQGIRGTEARLYPPADGLDRRIWQATFSADGGRRAGERGDGLMLSRTQPRPEHDRDLSLAELQLPIIDAYAAALPAGSPYRVLASRTALVVDPGRRDQALALAEPGLRQLAKTFLGADADDLELATLIRLTDTHVGTAEEVAESLAADRTLTRASDVAFQVHSIDAPHELTLRSLELLATEVAPRLGWPVGELITDQLRDAHKINTEGPR
ncbi:putative FMN-dependent luciferase-like monooxygenase [Microlunatus sp. GCM10028923]|uniref:putative FMN-dependent luciferase-like monooxygenase n=1 Tax=Microlunatus sp. GCM10028923 TaxID=3273400 RepID=UPI00361DD9C9